MLFNRFKFQARVTINNIKNTRHFCGVFNSHAIMHIRFIETNFALIFFFFRIKTDIEIWGSISVIFLTVACLTWSFIYTQPTLIVWRRLFAIPDRKSWRRISYSFHYLIQTLFFKKKKRKKEKGGNQRDKCMHQNLS